MPRVFFAVGLATSLVLAAEAVRTAPPPLVTIEAFQFSPATLTVRRGQSVRFVNRDATPHTVTPARDGMFVGSGRLLAGEEKTVTFDRLGTMQYFCEFHTTMTGTVMVR
jgi:plastocyanin